MGLDSVFETVFISERVLRLRAETRWVKEADNMFVGMAEEPDTCLRWMNELSVTVTVTTTEWVYHW